VPVPTAGGDPFWRCRQCPHKEYDRDGQPSGVKYRGTSITLADAEKPATNAPTKAPNPVYKNLAAYAQAHGVGVEVFVAAGWTDCTHWKRPALRFTTETAPRYRFLDGLDPKYTHAGGTHKGDARVWYKLPEALALAEQAACLALCNGEASTVVAQHYGVPALAPAGGGEHNLPTHLLTQLQDAWTGPIIVALDGDGKGRTAAPKLVEQLCAAGYDAHAVDLGPDFDLANFCHLHQADALNRLVSLPPMTEASDATSDANSTTRALAWTDDAPRLTDMGNARRFALLHGRSVRFVHTWGQWLIWNGTHWAKDETGGAVRLARGVVKSLYQEAADSNSPEQSRALAKHAMACESSGRLSAMLELAKSEEVIAAHHTQFDKTHWLLNCVNGTIDLHTGTLLPHVHEDYITKRIDVSYEPRAIAPRWAAFLNRITEGNTELQTYLQRAIGYSLTGDIRHQCLFFLYGSGSNGKSTFLEAIAPLFGAYYAKLAADGIMHKHNSSGIPNDIAALQGTRIVVASEIQRGMSLDEAKVKDMTGGDSISARFMRAEFFTFSPQFKLWLYGNHKPRIRGTDNGIWRRIRLIPFTATLSDTEKDEQLKDKLRAELPGILAWAVRGCLEWQRHGLPVPSCVTAASAKYREEMDTLGDFFADCCFLAPRAEAPSAALYAAYKEWAEASNERPMTQKALGIELEQRGFERGHNRARTARVWFGIGLLQPNSDTSDTLDTKIGISSQVLDPRGTNPKNVSNVSDVSENEPIAPPTTHASSITPTPEAVAAYATTLPSNLAALLALADEAGCGYKVPLIVRQGTAKDPRTAIARILLTYGNTTAVDT